MLILNSPPKVLLLWDRGVRPLTFDALGHEKGGFFKDYAKAKKNFMKELNDEKAAKRSKKKKARTA